VGQHGKVMVARTLACFYVVTPTMSLVVAAVLGTRVGRGRYNQIQGVKWR